MPDLQTEEQPGEVEKQAAEEPQAEEHPTTVDVIPEAPERKPEDTPRASRPPVSLGTWGDVRDTEARGLGVDPKITKPKKGGRRRKNDRPAEIRSSKGEEADTPKPKEEIMQDGMAGTHPPEIAPQSPEQMSAMIADLSRQLGEVQRVSVRQAEQLKTAAAEKAPAEKEGFWKQSTRGLGTRMVHTAAETVTVMVLIGIGYLLWTGVEYLFFKNDEAAL